MKTVYGIIAALVLAAAYLVSSQQAFAECGIASTYSSGTRTANGEAYNHMAVSAAHKTLPFGSRVVVRNQRTGRSITVRINDRGPFVAGRIIDLSTGAKNALGMDGLASVCLEVVSYGSGKKRGYEKPGVSDGLLLALNQGAQGGKARVVRSARGASSRTRAASASFGHERRRHVGTHRERKRYASVRRHKSSSRRAIHRRQHAANFY